MAERSDLYHDSRVIKEANSLNSNGFNVTVIGLRSLKKNLDNDFSFRMNTKYVLSRNFGVLRKLHLFILIFYLNLKILFIKSDYYHAHNTYFLPGMYLAKIIYSGILIYDSHEVQWELNTISKITEKFFINRVDKIINVSEGRAIHQSKKYSIPKDKIKVISNYPLLEQEVINKSFIDPSDKIKFIFSGGLNLDDNKIDNFIRSIQFYENISFDLMIFGYGKSALKIKKLINTLNLIKRVKIIPLVKPNEVVNKISNYHYTVNFIVNPNNLISIDYHSINKIYESISAGLPILCTNLPTFIAEIENNGIGYCVNPDSVDSIKSGIDLLIKNNHNLINIRNKTLQLAINKFNWSLEEEKLLSLYRSLNIY